jgi:hypothetical protein
LVALVLKKDCDEGAFDRVGVAQTNTALDQLLAELEERIDVVGDVGDALHHPEAKVFGWTWVHHGGRRTAVSKTK